MELLERIEGQIAATGLPLVGITLAAVPCPDTPIILTLHWHGFITEKLVDLEEAQPVAYTPIPSSALQVNERWEDWAAVDQATLDAAWQLGAWDVAAAQASGAWLIAVPHLVTVLESTRVRSIKSLEQLSFSKLQELFVDFSTAI